jgi:hypothetical protein
MTRMHFELIAETLKTSTPLARDGEAALQAWRTIVILFAQRLERDNGRFDKRRFFVACGLD